MSGLRRLTSSMISIFTYPGSARLRRIKHNVLSALTFFGLLLLILRPGADHAHEVRSFRLYADASTVMLQSMYNISTGRWSGALWWQQSNVLETVIDYSSRTRSEDRRVGNV